jgi:hypothetical protein
VTAGLLARTQDFYSGEDFTISANRERLISFVQSGSIDDRTFWLLKNQIEGFHGEYLHQNHARSRPHFSTFRAKLSSSDFQKE